MKPSIKRDRGFWLVETRSGPNFIRVYYSDWDKAIRVANDAAKRGLLDAAWTQTLRDYDRATAL